MPNGTECSIYNLRLLGKFFYRMYSCFRGKCFTITLLQVLSISKDKPIFHFLNSNVLITFVILNSLLIFKKHKLHKVQLLNFLVFILFSNIRKDNVNQCLRFRWNLPGLDNARTKTVYILSKNFSGPLSCFSIILQSPINTTFLFS